MLRLHPEPRTQGFWVRPTHQRFTGSASDATVEPRPELLCLKMPDSGCPPARWPWPPRMQVPPSPRPSLLPCCFRESGSLSGHRSGDWGAGGGAGALAAWKRVAHTVRGGGCAVFWNAIPKKRGRGDVPSAFRLRLGAPLFHRAKQMKTTHSWLFSSVPLASGPAEMSDSS